MVAAVLAMAVGALLAVMLMGIGLKFSGEFEGRVSTIASQQGITYTNPTSFTTRFDEIWRNFATLLTMFVAAAVAFVWPNTSGG